MPRALCGLLFSCVVAGCSQSPMVVAGLQLDNDMGPNAAGNGGEPTEAGSGGSADDAGSAGAGGEGSAAGGSPAPPNCDIDPWFWLKLAIVQRDCKVRITDEDLLRALEEFQRNLPIEPSSEERMYEPCDYLAVWFYQNPDDEQEYIVCPSKCLWLNDDVTKTAEARLACMADAGSAP